MSPVKQVTGISVQDLSASFLRSLRAENKSPRTVETYGDAVSAFARFLKDRGMPTTLDAVTREHVEAWIQDLLARWKPATAANRYRALQRFFAYVAEEGEIRANPMANMKPPKIPENPPDVLDDGQQRDLVKACEGSGYDDRRDAAIIMTFIDTGARLAEVAGLRMATLTSIS